MFLPEVYPVPRGGHRAYTVAGGRGGRKLSAVWAVRLQMCINIHICAAETPAAGPPRMCRRRREFPVKTPENGEDFCRIYKR